MCTVENEQNFVGGDATKIFQAPKISIMDFCDNCCGIATTRKVEASGTTVHKTTVSVV